MKTSIVFTLVFIFHFRTSESLNLHPKSLANIKYLIQHHIDRHLFPKTLRLLSYPDYLYTDSIITDPVTITEIFPPYTPMLIGPVRPLIKSPEPRSISTGRMVGWIEMYKYVTILHVSGQPGAVLRCIKDLRTIINQRWERILIVADNNAILENLMDYKVTQNLLHKFLVSLDTPNLIYADPLVYDAGRMVAVNSPKNLPMKKKMGGNLHGRHMMVAGCEFRPWMYRAGKDEKGRYIFEGDHVNIVKAGAAKFNYTFEISYDPSYGEYWEKNKTWTGMYGRVYYPEAGYHFTLVLSYEYDWSWGVDYPSTINTCELMFLTNHPRTELKWYAFLLPYSPIVWAWVMASTIFLGIVQFFVMYFYHSRVIKYVVVDSATFLPYAMAMEQGLCDIPKGARYLCLIWLLGCTVLGTGYKATLRNNLSFPKPEKVPLTFEELADRSDYIIWLYTLGSLERAYIAGSSMPALINIRERMILQYDVDKCLRDVYRNQYSACIGWSSLIIQEAARSLTVNTRVVSLLYSKNTPKLNIQSMAFQKDSIFVDSYQGITEAVYESGLVGKWEVDENLKFRKEGIARLNKEKEQDTSLYNMLVQQATQDDSDRKPLTMSNLWAIFAFIPVGVLISALLFGLEHYVWNKKEVDAYLMQYGFFKACSCTSRKRDSISNVAEPLKVVSNDTPVDISEQKNGEWYDPFGFLNQRTTGQAAKT